MPTINDQIAREKNAVSRGIERFYVTLEEDRAKGREFEGPVGQTMMRRLLAEFVPAVHQLQREARAKVVQAQTTGTRLGGWEMPLLALTPEEAGYITIKTLLSTPPDRATRQTVGRRVGTMCNLQVRWHELEAGEKARLQGDTPVPPYSRVSLLKREVKQLNPKSLRLWLKKLDDITTTEWSYEVRIKLGANLLGVLVDTCSADFEFVQSYSRRGKRSLTSIKAQLTPGSRKALEGSYEDFAEANPWLEPMLVEPLDWRWHEDQFVGGYYAHPEPLVKVSRDPHTHTIAAQDTIPEGVLTALNRVQRTPWRINAAVLQYARQAHDAELEAVLPVAPRRPMPPDVPAPEWAAMSQEARGAVKNERRLLHDHNHRLDAKRWSLRRQLALATELAPLDRFYYPHNMDFRGRAYPIPQDLHPQSDDFGRALLTFAEGKPLGADGLQWLVFHLANCYGMDKATRADQMGWYNETRLRVYDVATDPFGDGLPFWLGADEKHRWQFLAAALEVCRAYAHPAGPEAYVCHLPVHVDGSCNGLQHLSAMGRDPVGAHATNLTGDSTRQDIYQIVADKVSHKVMVDFSYLQDAPNPPAAAWYGKVTRNTVKRGVMTVPYGLTKIGMRDQLINDHWTDGLAGDPFTNAGYLRDLMHDAISDTVTAATEIMAWMQDNASILAKNDKAVQWWAPSGFLVRQCYTAPAYKNITTLVGLGKVRRMEIPVAGDATGPIRSSKQASSIAPNIVHSFDAAHMMMSVDAAADGLSFSVVHDSFGVHASDMPAFLGVVKDEFFLVYASDWLASLQEDFETSREGLQEINLMPPPAHGDFDVTQVYDSDFFFA